MGSETEPAKFLLPYLQRADELQKHEPLVAYYCRLYAMERGLKIPQKERTKTTSALLVSLMNQLEKDKKSVKLGPEDSLYVEGFASNVFAKADKQDRVGRADLNTAKTFYAASIFFEILNQFGELQPDIEQRQKYAVWKAAEIRKALKEGRRPEPGPPGDDKDLSLPSSSPTNTYDMGLTDSFQPSQPNGDTSSRDTDVDPGRSESFSASYTGADLGRTQSFSPINTGAYLGTSQSSAAVSTGANLHSPSFDKVNSNDPPQPHSSSFTYSTTTDYPSTDFHHLPPSNKPEIQAYPQPYPHQPYSGEQHSMPRNYHYPENPTIPYSHPNFQSYPSFHETSLPSAPSYHRTDASPHQSFPPATGHPSTPQLQPQHEYRNDSGSQTGHSSQNAAAMYTYDSSYQPPVEKIADAQKAARFAVGALAFDDLPVAVDHLRRALELLTNPSAENHKFD